MIAHINKSVNDRRNGVTSDKGFTLIELLVVVIIIGILAAIAIPMFLSQREAAWKASVETDVKNAAMVVETWAGSNNGHYNGFPGEGGPVTDGDGSGIKVSADNTIQVDVVDDNRFTIRGSNSNVSGTQLYDSRDGGLQDWTD